VAGFLAVSVVLACAVGYTVVTIATTSQIVDRMVSLRTPVALTSTEMVGNLYSTLATLRGYLLTGNPQGKADRAGMWSELNASIARMDEMASRFTDAENKRRWAEARVTLGEFRAAQDKAESAAFTPDAFPATKLLTTTAAPLVETMFAEITRLINEEEALEATPERKRLLKQMADVRGNFANATAQIRMYLLSGDKAYKDQFNKFWEIFGKAYAGLKASTAMLTPSQRAAFDKFAKANDGFAPLPEKVFALRDSPEWNQPVRILVTEAAPRALKLLDLIDGPKNADGGRSGGIKTSQQRLLASESRAVLDGMSFLATAEWALLATGLGLAAAIAFFTVRSIAPPLQALTGGMKRLASGDFGVVLPGLGRRDEVGEMAQAVEDFKVKAAEKARREAEEKAEADRQTAATRKADMVKLADEFEAAVGEIVQTVSSASTELEASATTLTKTAETTQQLSTVVAAASEEASVNVQSVASATEELVASVTEIGRQVQESSRIANEAVGQAKNTDNRITKLAQAASRIGDVTQLITSIAEQTNLLALNATIEAARAGESGKGFAVVAQEVKQLAAQTAKATNEISTQISEMQSATQDSVTAIKEIGGTIGRISEIATTIASAVEEQGAATQEITRNVQQASAGTTEVASNITNVSRGAAETGSASSQVLSSAQSLANESNRLKLEMGKFLVSVRAA
jgi:methyl-accepting chemotaxis protein